MKENKEFGPKVYSEKSVFSFPLPASHINALVPCPDGKILIAASGTNFVVDGQLQHALARIEPDGAIDLVFARGDESWVEGRTIALQTDNRILLGGRKFESSAYSMLFHRLEPNGSVDGLFNPELDPAENPLDSFSRHTALLDAWRRTIVHNQCGRSFGRRS